MQFIPDSCLKNNVAHMLLVSPSQCVLELKDARSQSESSQVQPHPAKLSKPRTDLFIASLQPTHRVNFTVIIMNISYCNKEK